MTFFIRAQINMENTSLACAAFSCAVCSAAIKDIGGTGGSDIAATVVDR